MPLMQKKRRTLITISCLAIAYIILVVMMLTYERSISKLLSQRFDNCVRRSLIETARLVEEKDMLNIINDIARDTTEQSKNARAILNDTDPEEVSDLLFGNANPTSVADVVPGSVSRNEVSKDKLQDARQLMLEVLARKYEDASSRSIQERIDPVFLRNTFTRILNENGITDSFSFVVVCRHAGIIEHFGEKPFNFDDSSDVALFEQTLFRREVNDRPLSLIVKVEGRPSYIFRYTWHVLPIILCMTILFILLIYTIYYIIRKERLAEIQKAFVKNMTHELKTPVASISLASEMLADPSLSLTPETYTSKCRIINSEAKRLTNIIERVLQSSVLEQKSFSYSTDSVNINEIVTSARESFILKVQQQSIGGKILLNLNADQHIIYADRVHLTNVVYNLMDNAIKYREPSRPLIIEISTRNTDGRIFVEFGDNGVGISDEHIKRIFDKFYRIPTGNRHDVKGFGLGLSYVKHVVTNNGGNISVQSKLGVGTRFTLDFQAFRA